MGWIIPKTNWAKDDRFNAVDYNRINNNIFHLRTKALELYKSFDIVPLVDKTYSDYIYADEMNQIETNLNTVIANTIKLFYGNTPIFSDNDAFVDYIELNRIESITLDIYERLDNLYNGRRMFTWNFGMEDDF